MAKIRKIQRPPETELAKKRVAAYARVSSGKDTMLHSLSAQVSYYGEFIRRNADWEFAGVYADEALTGTKDERPEFRRLLADCRAGQIDMVITKSISRFARNTVALLQATRELKVIGVDVFFEEQNIHTLSGEGEMILTLLASVAQEESRAVSENCKWRIRNQFRNGDLANLRFLYGYTIHKGVISINLTEAEVVRTIFLLYLAGTGVDRIARHMASLGIQKPRGGAWTSARVLEILKNEKYAGNALLQKRYIPDYLSKREVRNTGKLPQYFATDTHPAIISVETFERAQVLLEENRRKNNIQKSPGRRYPFSGLLRCGNCGKPYKRVVCHGRACWQCSTYLLHGKTACPAKQIPESVLHALACDALGSSSLDERLIRQHISEITIPAPNKLIFGFSDGHIIEKEWRDRSRSESWTEEMKQKARERGNA